jgi:hypothetical protein
MAESFRVWLVMANQKALDGFWAHRTEALPKQDEIIIVDNLLNPGALTRARVTSVTPGGDPEIYATPIDEQ